MAAANYRTGAQRKVEERGGKLTEWTARRGRFISRVTRLDDILHARRTHTHIYTTFSSFHIQAFISKPKKGVFFFPSYPQVKVLTSEKPDDTAVVCFLARGPREFIPA